MPRKQGHISSQYVCILLLVATSLEEVQTALPDGVNNQYFVMLCRVYNTALKPPIPVLDDTTAVEIKTIGAIKWALSTPEWLEQIKNASAGKELPQALKERHPRVLDEVKIWSLVSEDRELLEKYPQNKFRSTTVRIHAKRMEQVFHQALKVAEDLEKANQNESRNQVQSILNGVITGKEAETLEEGQGWAGISSAGSGRKDACGQPFKVSSAAARGQIAGDSLIGDLLCLCAPQATSNGQRFACGDQIGGKGDTNANKWDGSNPPGSNFAPIWQTIKPYCNATRAPPAHSVKEARTLVSQIMTAINTGDKCVKTAGSGFAVPLPGTLGTFLDSDCTGSSAGCQGNSATDGGACVVYNTNVVGEDGIKWVKSFLRALDEIDKIAPAAEGAKQDRTLLRMLQTRAEEIYEDAKTHSETEQETPEKPIQSQTSDKNPNSPAGAAGAQGPNAVNATTDPRFILPWILLI